MKRIGTLILTVTCFLGLCLVPFARRAAADIPQFGYTIQDLGTFPGDVASDAHDLNSAGWVVGSSTSSSGISHAFLWTPGAGMQRLTPSASTWSIAYGINNWGQVVGEVSTSVTNKAFLYTAGQFQTLPLGVGFDTAYDINNAGWIVGSHNSEYVAFLYKSPVQQATWISPPNLSAKAFAVNQRGDAVGDRLLASSGPFHAFRWEYNGFWNTWIEHDLGTLGGDNSSAQDINAAGKIVGYARIGGSGYRAYHAFLWTPPPYRSGESPMKDLGFLPGLSPILDSVAYGINAHDDVVGAAAFLPTLGGDSFACIWSHGVAASLNTLLPSGRSGWVLSTAEAINDQGQICGTGLHNGHWRAFLLTPVALSTLPAPGR